MTLLTDDALAAADHGEHALLEYLLQGVKVHHHSCRRIGAPLHGYLQYVVVPMAMRVRTRAEYT